MAIEIEHKFLLKNDTWRDQITRSVKYRQGYLSASENGAVRVRSNDNQAWLTIKSATNGTHRFEYEYEIPFIDADEMLNKLCAKPLIEKTRHYVYYDDTWEIDEFDGDNHGLIVAEIELNEVGQAFSRPLWLGLEVTDDARYYNSNLAIHPYSEWLHG